MLKFLRKYNTIIMVIGGVLLMIAFLLPQAIQQVGRRIGNKPVATLDGRSIKSTDFAKAGQEILVLKKLAFVPTSRGVVSLIDTLLDPEADTHHWILLTEAAKRAGFVGDRDHGEGYLDELAQIQVVMYYNSLIAGQVGNPALAMRLAEQQFESEDGQAKYQEQRQKLLRARSEIASRSRMLPEDVDRALSKLRGVQRMKSAYINSIRMSSVEAERVASYYTDSVVADVLQIPADELVDPNLNPTDEQLAAHFEKYKAFKPGEEGLGFGYRLPDRVKLQWIELDRQAIYDAVEIDVLDIAKAHQADHAKYPGELADERARIEADLRNARVKYLLDLVETTIRAEIGRLTRPLPSDGEYKKLPPNWTTPDLFTISAKAAQAVRTKEDMPTFPTPRVVRRDAQWLDAQKMLELEGIGRAAIRSTNAGAQAFPMIGLALSVKELDPETPRVIQVGIPYTRERLEDAQGNRYIMTVTDAVQEAVPDSIDDLIEPQRVRDDWRKAQAYAFLTAQRGTLEALAIEDGLDAVTEALFPVDVVEADQRPTIQRGVEFGVSLTRSGNGRVAYDSDEVREQVRQKAEKLDPMTPLAEVPPADRTLAVEAEPVRSLLMVRIIGLSPLTKESFRLVRDQAVKRGVEDDISKSKVYATPLAFDELKKSLHYVLSERAAKQLEDKLKEQKAASSS